MKKFIALVVIGMLFGCQNLKQSLPSRLDATMETIATMKGVDETNHRRYYFDYYLPRHLGTRFSSADSITFVRNQFEFYMSLNIPTIIMQTYYPLEEDSLASHVDFSNQLESLVYHKKGTMVNFKNVERTFELSIKQVEEHYLVLLQFGRTDFSALLPIAELEETIYDMFFIARSLKIDTSAVLKDYSNKAIVTIKNKYNLFESVFPENGVVDQVLNQDKNNNVHEEIIDPSEEDPRSNQSNNRMRE